MFVFKRMLGKFAKVTEPIRHKIVKTISPVIYYSALYRYHEDTPREAIKFIGKHFKNFMLTGLEIGASRGINALSILQTLKIKTLYLIDPYEPYLDINRNNEQFINAHLYKAELFERLFDYHKKIRLLYARSDKALKAIKEKLDFIYIDGNHNFEWVMHDLTQGYKILKRGGILCGHDYTLIDDVTRAVHIFVKEHNLDFMAKTTDFWIIK